MHVDVIIVGSNGYVMGNLARLKQKMRWVMYAVYHSTHFVARFMSSCTRSVFDHSYTRLCKLHINVISRGVRLLFLCESLITFVCATTVQLGLQE
jgi:hypothetical protein